MRRMTMNEQSTNNGQNISKEMVLSLFTIEISEFWPLKMFNVLKGICPQNVNFFFQFRDVCSAWPIKKNRQISKSHMCIVF